MNLDLALGTDIAHIGDLQRTASGDLGTYDGLVNITNAIFHRLMTVPGTLIHRPTYGVGLPQYQNAITSFSMQQKLAKLIAEQVALDPRIQSVTNVSIQSTDGFPEQTIIKVFAVVIGYNEQVMTYAPFSTGG
jgi:phage baseplate assembly protein W